MRRLCVFAFASLLCFSTFAWASSENAPAQRRWVGLLGVDAGLGFVPSSVTGEADNSGYSVALKAIGSYYTSKWVFEGALSWWRNRVSGTRTTGDEILVENSSVFVELGARYLIGTSWELGGFALAAFGEDLSFRPYVLPLRAEPAKSMLFGLGAQGLYRFYWSERWLARAGLRITTDLTVPDRQLWLLQAVLHVGLDFGLGSSTQPPPPLENKTTPVRKQPRLTKVNLPPIHFEVGSATLEGSSRGFLEELGQSLAKQSASWGSIEIGGHSDARGDEQVNRSLSEKRAFAVKQALVDGGVPAQRIESHGYGSDRPLIAGDNPTAWNANRRVELLLSPDSDIGAVSGEIDRLRKKYRL